MCFGKFADEGDNLLNNPNLYNVEGDHRKCVENPSGFFLSCSVIVFSIPEIILLSSAKQNIQTTNIFEQFQYNKTIQTCVMNNDWILEIFKKSYGKPQGYPLSALFFVQSVEMMALRIRNNKDIKGFQIKIDEQTHSKENHRHSTSEPPFSWLSPLFPQS